ncbi:trace amine-associated receptor 7h-like [Actinia tenebrosa]|uniref:Trace amine-associated receptor 7h-like n=1 Tax=Actinia tenebrosa TaxID=6105 RepID=A0A6P8HFR6_ACTTE|nr:trace amine-associated receptor 7h-like [Actinia tenebrosa]XP_031551427.1 trace amine-associated receptor 7h-like [Actinia tenebrosa]
MSEFRLELRQTPNETLATEPVSSCPFVQSNLLYLDYLREVYIVNCILNAIFSLVAVFFNGVIFVSIRRTPSLHDPSHLLISILACTDLGVGLIEQPIYVLNKAAELNRLGKISCVTGAMTNMLAGLLAGMSFLTMTFISIDRFLALHLHLRYKAIVTKSLVLKATFVSFISFSLCVSFYPWLPSVPVYGGITIIIICLMVSTILYCRIYKIVRKHHLQIRNSAPKQQRHESERIVLKKYWKSVVGFVVVHLVMVLCYLPYAIALGMRAVSGITKEYKLILNVTTTIIYLNSSMNPLVFCWRIREVRNAVVKTLKQLFRKQSESSQTSRVQVNGTSNHAYVISMPLN